MDQPANSARQPTPSPARLPVIFIGHGSPMNALEENRFTDTWRALGEATPKPRAVLAISAHWLTDGIAVTAMPVRQALARRDFAAVVDYRQWGQDAALSVPSAEHFLPLLYVVGAARDDDRLTLLSDEIVGSSISMLSVVAGNCGGGTIVAH